jgi:hypothetical protein
MEYIYADDAESSLGSYVQSAQETKLFTVDYSKWLGQGETIAAWGTNFHPVTTDPITTSSHAIVSGDAGPSTAVSFLAGGGDDGNAYTLTITATTSLGQVKVDLIDFFIGEQPDTDPWLSGSPFAVPASGGSGGSGGGSSSTAIPLSVGSGSFVTNHTVVDTSGELIVAARTGPSGTGRIAVTLKNFGTDTVFIGATSGVGAQSFPLYAGEALTLNTQAAVYGQANSATQDVHYIETF